MTTVRLSGWHKELILAALLEHTFKAREKELEDEQQLLGLIIYRDLYSEKTRELMDSLPSCFLPTIRSVKCKFRSVKCKFGDEVHVYELWADYRVPDADRRDDYRVRKVYGHDDPITHSHFGLQEKAKALYDEKSTAKAGALAVLGRCSTYKKLIETWPEIEPFAKPYGGVQRAVLTPLAFPIQDLNHRFRLPVEAQGAPA